MLINDIEIDILNLEDSPKVNYEINQVVKDRKPIFYKEEMVPKNLKRVKLPTRREKILWDIYENFCAKYFFKEKHSLLKLQILNIEEWLEYILDEDTFEAFQLEIGSTLFLNLIYRERPVLEKLFNAGVLPLMTVDEENKIKELVRLGKRKINRARSKEIHEKVGSQINTELATTLYKNFNKEKVFFTEKRKLINIIPSYKNLDFKYTGAYILIDSLIRNSVWAIFGYPGGAVLPVYDELYFWENRQCIVHYLVRHEQGAAHAADGFSRATGNIGVCIATSGPGATNLLTGIATAALDSIPLLVLTGQVNTFLMGSDAFQEIDIFTMTLPIAKYSYIIRDLSTISHDISKAIYIAQNGKPGPVVIDFPKDSGIEFFQKAQLQYKISTKQQLLRKVSSKFVFWLESNKLNQMFRLLKQTSRPILYVGGGVLNANCSELVVDFALRNRIPITTTLMGKGIIDEDHALSLGMLGMHGTAYANFAISTCELLIAVGVRFDDRVTGNIRKFAPKATIIHIDIDPTELGKNKFTHLGIRGDLRIIFHELIKEELIHNIITPQIQKTNKKKFIGIEVQNYLTVKKKKLKTNSFEWLKKVFYWKILFPLTPKLTKAERELEENKNLFLPQDVIKLTGKLQPNAFFTTDVGQHQMWAAQFLTCKPRRWMSSAGLGTMGYGVPAAIGVQISYPMDKVICITGDSSFQMNLQELGTIAKYELPIKILIINNKWQGMVRQWQETFYQKRYSHSNMEKGSPNFTNLANSYGLDGVSIYSRQQMNQNLEKLLSLNKPTLIEFVVNEKENVYPMVKQDESSKMLGIPEHTAQGETIDKNKKINNKKLEGETEEMKKKREKKEFEEQKKKYKDLIISYKEEFKNNSLKSQINFKERQILYVNPKHNTEYDEKDEQKRKKDNKKNRTFEINQKLKTRLKLREKKRDRDGNIINMIET